MDISAEQVLLRWRPTLRQADGFDNRHFAAQVRQYLLDHQRIFEAMTFMLPPQTRLVTIGSPLGDENVKSRLKGAQARSHRKYPHNIGRWVNSTAEDDYISHDPTLANDYRKMLQLGLTASITDRQIYNLAIRGDNSNPHHGAGYLIHPQVCREVK